MTEYEARRDERKRVADKIRKDHKDWMGITFARIALAQILDWIDRRDQREERKNR